MWRRHFPLTSCETVGSKGLALREDFVYTNLRLVALETARRVDSRSCLQRRDSSRRFSGVAHTPAPTCRVPGVRTFSGRHSSLLAKSFFATMCGDNSCNPGARGPQVRRNEHPRSPCGKRPWRQKPGWPVGDAGHARNAPRRVSARQTRVSAPRHVCGLNPFVSCGIN